MPSEKPLRLFFALSCPAELADGIFRWRESQDFSGRPVAKDNLHLTLAFLGSQPSTAVEGLMQLGDQLPGEAFTLGLDHVRTIGHGFLCLTPTQAPPALLQLVEDLRSSLSPLGLALDSRRFLPHVTLAREADTPQPCHTTAAFEWQVDGFGLFRSENIPGGVRYDELAHWPLTAPSS